MAWLDANEAPIRPLCDVRAFTSARPNWGYQLRLGLFMIGERDMRAIAEAMQARLPA